MIRSTLLLAGLLPLTALAQDAEPEQEAETHTERSELETVVVSALPIERSKLDSAQPIDVLFGEELDDRRGLTLGETLKQQPGVHSTSYGPGAGRPVIRGLGGGRVQVLEDSLPSVDVSAQSDDHAVSVEPMLIDRVEILRGPATLLYGSGAVGGVVNVIDGRIPESVPYTPLEGRFEVRGNTVADEKTGVLRLDGGSGNWAWNISGSWRDAGDYEIPGYGELEMHEDHEHEEGDHDHDDHEDEEERVFGTLENSFVESQSGSVGASWIGARGFFGMSLKRFETEYGIPAPHAHGDEEDHDHGGHGLAAFRYSLLSEEDHDHEDEHGHEEEDVFIDLEQTRWDAKGALNDPLPGFTRATLRTSYSDYTHAERSVGEGHGHEHEEEEHEHEEEHGHSGDHVHTRFDVEAWNARLELEHRPVAGWRGAVGFQFEHESLSATGEEAYIPDGDTLSWALFVLEEKRTGPLTWTLGARVERNEIEVDELIEHHDHEGHEGDHDDDHEHGDEHDAPLSRDFTTVSGSAGVLWRIDDRWQTSLNYSYAQRAPSQGDLYANGPHAATFTFERGAVDLDEEVTNGFDFIVHRHGEDFDLEASLFYNAIDDFIYLGETGEEEDGLPLRTTRQEDATFYGGELLATWHLPRTAVGHFDLRAGYDWVRAELDSGENLPRISPARYLAGVDWHLGDFRGSLDYQHVTDADDLAPNETPTDGYDMLDVNLSYFFDLGGAELEAFARFSNLLDEEARVHTSYLKNFAPLPGRNFGVGLRGRF
ncbi:MAG: TonB-dependent receptor [Gammaproteobacteria bacterium]|jgi:iron complex outermembrane receptor protein|nr:TonB-dependent receptor [Gammaproteobacteria bacterium]